MLLGGGCNEERSDEAAPGITNRTSEEMVRLVGNDTLSAEKRNIRKSGSRRERNVIWRYGGFVMSRRRNHTRPGVEADEGLWGKLRYHHDEMDPVPCLGARAMYIR